VRDRDRLRKEHLERLGWRVHRLWSTAWFTDPAGELAKLRTAFDSAVGAAPPPPPAPATQAGDRETPSDEPDTWTAPVSPTPAESRASAQAESAPQPEGEPWPRAAPPPRIVRVIPLGPGERPRLRTSAARALPASDRGDSTPLPPSSGPDPR
jgi:hypothetical protein